MVPRRHPKKGSSASEESTDNEGDGDNILRPFNPGSSITSLEVYMKERKDFMRNSEGAEGYTSDVAVNRSIEIFFGNLTNFGTFYQSLADNGYKTPKNQDENENYIKPDPNKTTVNPCAVKKLCLVGHPLTSFKGLNSFKKLSEAWVTNCSIKELRWNDFKGLEVLQRLYLFGGHITTVEPLYFENLKVLWLSGNKLKSLSFLTHGMPSLCDLNVANNQITCLEAEQLFKCFSLLILNVAGNPLCTIQDVQSVNVLSNLRHFFLVDPMYGKCPVTSLCESRAMLVQKLINIVNLNGQDITDHEKRNVQEYIHQRCLYYYTNSVSSGPSHASLRKVGLSTVYKQLENLGIRIIDLATMSAKCLQADYHMTSLPMFAKTKQQLLIEVAKIHTRLSGLKQWSRVILRRVATILRISRWEQRMEEWTKWIEFQSFGTILSYIVHSILDPESLKDKDNIRGTLHQLFGSLSCSKPWPRNSILKIETIIVIKDKGSEAGMDKVYEDNFANKNEPKFMPPPPEEVDPPTPDIQATTYPFYGPPSVQPLKVVTTYTDPNYKVPSPIFPYPESVPGLPERSQPLLMFLICRTPTCDDPLEYFTNLLFEKSRYYKEIKLTNCLWAAVEINHTDSKGNVPASLSYSIVCVVKVLEECLTPLEKCRAKMRQHNRDCFIFGVTEPLCYAPAYVVFVSHTPNDKGAIWYEGITEDSDVTEGAETLLEDLGVKLGEFGGHTKMNTPYYLHRTHDGVKADLTAITKIIPNDPRTPDSKSSNIFVKSRSGVDLLSVAKFLGPDISLSITSLDLCGNRLGLTVGLEGLSNLRKLNLSHNNLTTLSGLHKLPHLKELRAGWNYLRFLHSNISTLAWACCKITTLELLPNPFQDVRDFSHIPVLAVQAMPYLKRVDAWTVPFKAPVTIPISSGNKLNIDANFTKEVMKYTWVGPNIMYSDFKGKCLINLDDLPPKPPFPEGFGNNGMELDLSENYLTSPSLFSSAFVQNAEWRAALVKLQLQENAISNLDWMGERIFPNLHILNLSNNQLSDLELIQHSCPNLIHLQLSSNPFPTNTFVLNPLRNMKHLKTIDLSRTPVAANPEYASYVLKHLRSVQILDGIPMIDWNTEETIYKLGGTLSTDWLEVNIGHKDWNYLTELSLPNCGLQKVHFPPGSLPKLLSLDLSGNSMTCLSGLTSLPNLRVLCVSNNSIMGLGDATCPTCYGKTVDQFARGRSNLYPDGQDAANKNLTIRAKTPERNKFKSSTSVINSQSEPLSPRIRPPSRGTNPSGQNIRLSQSIHYSPPGSARGGRGGVLKPIFPQLEVLVMSHNGLTGVEDLHLHALPSLRTVILNCNQIKGFDGLENLPTVRAIVLDNNRISNVPFNCLSGCKSLKYLHLEHNRITTLPRLPHLANLAALYLGYNRIQSLTDIGCLASLGVQELTLIGNPANFRSGYCRNIVGELPHLQKLDGTDLFQLRWAKGSSFASLKLQEKTTFEPSNGFDPRSGFVPHGGLRIHPKAFPIENIEE